MKIFEYMYFFKRTFLTQILLLGVPGTKYFQIGVRGQIHRFLAQMHTFSRFFKNSRSKSSQRRAVSLYICYFSIVKAQNNAYNSQSKWFKPPPPMKNIQGGPTVNPCTQGPEFGVTPLCVGLECPVQGRAENVSGAGADIF